MDIPTPEELVSHYEAFCKRHDMAETRFGREATGEPQLIQSIRNGRSPSLNVLNRVKAYIADKDSALATAEWPVASSGNGGENSGSATEADSPRPFAPSCATCSPTSAHPPSSPDSPASSTTGAEAA
jgi:hypothetical protein